MALTLRLNDEEEKALAVLMKKFECKTASGTLKKIILTLSSTLKEYETLRYKHMDLKNDLSHIKDLLKEQQRIQSRESQIQDELTSFSLS